MRSHPREAQTRFAGGDGVVLIRAESFFLHELPDAPEGRYVFGYQIGVKNAGAVACRLLWRRWEITDGEGRQREVRGSGVVGKQPRLDAGESFEYRSFCPLATPTGSMRGGFVFMCDDGSMFEAPIAEFALLAHEDAAWQGDAGSERPEGLA